MCAVEAQTITQRSVKGSAWLFSGRLVANVIRLAAVAILARHLSPGDFGLVALAQVLLQFSVLAADNGIGTYVICDRETGWERRMSSAFWLNLGLTAGQLLILCAATPFLSRFYENWMLGQVLSGLAVVFLFQQMAVVPEALVRRNLQYQNLVVRDTVCQFITAVFSVAMALAGWGIWSLVIPQVIMEPVRFVAILSIAKWRPRFSAGLEAWPKIIRYSANLLGMNFFGLIANDGDTLLVGKVLGVTSLGYYNLAWQLSNLVGRNVTGVVSAVALPALAILKEDVSRLQSAYRRLLRMLAAISFPFLMVLFVLAPDLIRLVYGPRWDPVTTLLRIFIVFTVVRSVTSPCALIFNIVGRPDVGFKFAFAFLPFYVAAIYVGSWWGLIGVATGVMIVRTSGAVLALALSTRLISLSFMRIIADLTVVGIAALVANGIVWAVNIYLMAQSIDPITRVVTCVVCAGILYSLCLARFDRKTYGEVTKLVSSLIPNVGSQLNRLMNHPLLVGAGK